MKSMASLVAPFVVAFMSASPALAADAPEDRRAAEIRLEEAQERLEQAARDIADLTSDLGGSFVASFDGLGHRRAMLGVNIADPGRDRDEGVEVTGVSPGGPADEAGLQAGDVLLAVDGERLRREDGRGPNARLLELMRGIEPGTTVEVEYERAGRKREAEIVTEAFGPFPFELALGDGRFRFDVPDIASLPGLPFFGQWGDMELTSLTPELGSYFGTEEGLLVVRAPDHSTFKLRDGDVILAIAGREPESPGHAMRILRSYQPGEELRIEIVRKQKKQTLDITIPESDAVFEDARFHRGPPPRHRIVRRALTTT